jgi:ABC-type phosphate transport system substrate-binding protein
LSVGISAVKSVFYGASGIIPISQGEIQMTFRRKISVVAALAIATTAAVSTQANAAAVGGGGASFMANMMDICASGFNKNELANPGKVDTITYASVGSSAGKTGFANGTYKFGGSESAYSSGTAPANLVYVPLIGGAIAIGYRVDGMSPANAQVRLTSETVAKIFAGQIKKWNDPAILASNKATTVKKKLSATKLGVTVTAKKVASNVTFSVKMTAAARTKYKNAKVTISAATLGGATKSILSARYTKPVSKTTSYVANTTYQVNVGKNPIGVLAVATVRDGVTITMPDLAIRVVHRSDGSGTTNNFINFLNKSFPSIWNKPTSDTYSTGFPGTLPSDGSFQSAKGNEGLAGYVSKNNGAITYAELSFLEELGVAAAAIQNPAKLYVSPSPITSASWLEGAGVSAEGLVTQDYAYTATDAYPINAVSYGLVSSAASADMAISKRFFDYFLNKCAPKSAPAAGYTPLVGKILEKAAAQLAKVNGGA